MIANDPLIQQLLAANAAGIPVRYDELPLEQREHLTSLFQPIPGQGFTDEQRTFFTAYWLDATGRDSEIADYNAGPQPHKLGTVPLADGTPMLPSSLLTWMAPGDGYAPAREILANCPLRAVAPEEWPQPDPEELP